MGGITSKFRYKVLSEYIKKFDLALFGETKLQKIPQSEFPDFDILSLKQKTRLHGLSILIKKERFKYTKKLNTKSKSVLWLLLGTSESNVNLIVGSVYVPGYDSKFADPNDFDLICEDMLTLHEKYNTPFLLMGDFNSRTGNHTDHSDTLNLQVTIPPRYNMDKKVDTYGRKLLKMCMDLNLKIINGRYGSDCGVGSFTCHKKNRGALNESVVDYCITSEDILPCIADFYVDSFDKCMSDVHSPICIDITNVPTIKNTQKISNENCETLLYKPGWKPESKAAYINSFSENDIMQVAENF